MNIQTQIRFAAAPTRGAPVSIAEAPQETRFTLRIAPADLAAASDAFGLSLPQRIGDWTSEGGRASLRLGPDEWTLRAPDGEAEVIAASFAGLPAEIPHSLVETSDREIGLIVEGGAAADLLAVGVALDLDRFPVGRGTRTVIEGVQVTLWRESRERFRVEAWRSFMPFLHGLLDEANAELAIGL